MGANIQPRTVQWATGAFGAAVPNPASPQCECVSVTYSSGPVTAESPVPAWSNEAAAGSTETTRVNTVDITQVYKYINTPGFTISATVASWFWFWIYFSPVCPVCKVKTTLGLCTLNGLNLNFTEILVSLIRSCIHHQHGVWQGKAQAWQLWKPPRPWVGFISCSHKASPSILKPHMTSGIFKVRSWKVHECIQGSTSF